MENLLLKFRGEYVKKIEGEKLTPEEMYEEDDYYRLAESIDNILLYLYDRNKK